MLRASTARATQTALKKAASGIKRRTIQRADWSVGGARPTAARALGWLHRQACPVPGQDDAGQTHADEIQDGGHDAGEHDGQEFTQHDLGAGRRADQEGLHRPPFLLAGAKIHRRVEGARQRHHDQEEWEDEAPGVALDLLNGRHVMTLDLNWLGVTPGQVVLFRPRVHDSALPAIEELTQPEIGVLAGLVHAPVKDRNFDVVFLAKLTGQIRRDDHDRRGRAVTNGLLAPLGGSPGSLPRLGLHQERARILKRIEEPGIESIPPGAQQRHLGGKILGPHHHNDPGLFLSRGGCLDDAISQDRVEQDRKDEDHEQRTPVADLVENLAAENHEQVRPAHESVSSSVGE